MAQPLENRITSALRTSSRLKDVETAIKDVEAEIIATQKKHDAEVALSVDPALTTPQAREARNNAADLEHDVRRLAASLEMLNKRRQTILDDEAYAKRLARYEAAQRERDDLVRVIQTRYPAIAFELLEMARRIEKSDAECKVVNGDRPRGAIHLASAEAIARGCGENFSIPWASGGGAHMLTRIKDSKVPFMFDQGGYLPIQVSNLTQNMDVWKLKTVEDQERARSPLSDVGEPNKAAA